MPSNWITDLEDESCDSCGIKPSRHQGHGSYTCKACWDAQWCPECRYPLNVNHVCPDQEERRRREMFSSLSMYHLGIGKNPAIDVIKALIEHHDAICSSSGSCKEIEDAKLLLDCMEKDTWH